MQLTRLFRPSLFGLINSSQSDQPATCYASTERLAIPSRMFSTRIPLTSKGLTPFLSSLFKRLFRYVLQPTLALFEHLPIRWVGISNASHIKMTTLGGLMESISDHSGDALDNEDRIVRSSSQNPQRVADSGSIPIKPWHETPKRIVQNASSSVIY